MNIFYHYYDIPKDIEFYDSVAIDTEAMGLNNKRDRLCVVQLSSGEGDAHLVHFPEPKFQSPNLLKILNDSSIQKIFHFARFDVAILQHTLNIDIQNIYCTKIASRLTRTYTDLHGLKDLCLELLGIKISKQQGSSDWGTNQLTKEQIEYAANDVLHLHKLKLILDEMLIREGRLELAKNCFTYIPTRAKLDVLGWDDSLLAH